MITNFIKKFIKDVVDSAKTNKSGFSGRKLSALVTMLCVIALHYPIIKAAIEIKTIPDLVLYTGAVIVVLAADYSFIAACLGMVMYENTKKKPNEETDNNSPA